MMDRQRRDVYRARRRAVRTGDARDRSTWPERERMSRKNTKYMAGHSGQPRRRIQRRGYIVWRASGDRKGLGEREIGETRCRRRYYY